MKHKQGCLICGEALIYHAEEQRVTCYYCKNDFHSNVSCANNHYVCDRCHAQSGMDFIESFCLHSTSVNPLEMATEIMESDKILMHGPEHHFLVPAVLIASFSNVSNDGSKSSNLKLARSRAEKIPGGFCGTHGNCGAAVGTGIFISIITQATPLSKENWQLSNLITGRTLLSVASHGGPRCCKRDVYLSIEEAIKFMQEHFNITLGSSRVTCRFSANNRECLKRDCLYHPAHR